MYKIGGGVRIDLLTQKHQSLVLPIVRLTQLPVWKPGALEPHVILLEEDNDAPHPITASSPAHRASTQRIPIIRIGEKTGIRLPGGEEELAELLIATVDDRKQHATPNSQAEQIKHPVRIVVAGWQGGVGTSSIAWGLAQSTDHAIYVDATGTRTPLTVLQEQGVRTQGVFWSDLDRAEATFTDTLFTQLPFVHSTPFLIGDERGGATCHDPRLLRINTAFMQRNPVEHQRKMFIDAGRWDESTAQAHLALADCVLMVGWADTHSTALLATTLGDNPVRTPLVIVHSVKYPFPLLKQMIPEISALSHHPCLRETPTQFTRLTRREKVRTRRLWALIEHEISKRERASSYLERR